MKTPRLLLPVFLVIATVLTAAPFEGRITLGVKSGKDKEFVIAYAMKPGLCRMEPKMEGGESMASIINWSKMEMIMLMEEQQMYMVTSMKGAAKLAEAEAAANAPAEEAPVEEAVVEEAAAEVAPAVEAVAEDAAPAEEAAAPAEATVAEAPVEEAAAEAPAEEAVAETEGGEGYQDDGRCHRRHLGLQGRGKPEGRQEAKHHRRQGRHQFHHRLHVELEGWIHELGRINGRKQGDRNGKDQGVQGPLKRSDDQRNQ